ncbi:hypothetical protein DL96DRAFT_1717535 [Flagelloscypha sp. PMI_526]|nr:hypothetical protein DL96DRAFT_1717535 [Flagelloscypha sp. PMI_526]
MLGRGKGVLLAQLFTFVSAATTTIDDTDNAWTWNNNTDGSISWYLIKPTRGCTVCGDWLPNATSPTVPVDGAYNMTFHAAHTDSTGLLKFRGNAISIYGIQFPGPGTITFSFNGSSLTYQNPPQSTIQYDFLLWQAHDLSEEEDHLVSFSAVAGALIDYAVVTSTTLDREPNSGAMLPCSTIAGIAAGPLTLIVIIALLS